MVKKMTEKQYYRSAQHFRTEKSYAEYLKGIKKRKRIKIHRTQRRSSSGNMFSSPSIKWRF